MLKDYLKAVVRKFTMIRKEAEDEIRTEVRAEVARAPGVEWGFCALMSKLYMSVFKENMPWKVGNETSALSKSP